jgi:Flp pilus assembly protein TadD
MVVGEEAEATEMLDKGLDRERPEANLLSLLASLKYQAADYEEAEELYSLGQKKFPYDPKWGKALAKVYLVTKNEAKLATALESLALADPDDAVIRKKLAQMALDRSDFAAARRWATETIHCDVMDADAHRMLAEASDKLGNADEAQFERETLKKLEQSK